MPKPIILSEDLPFQIGSITSISPLLSTFIQSRIPPPRKVPQRLANYCAHPSILEQPPWTNDDKQALQDAESLTATTATNPSDRRNWPPLLHSAFTSSTRVSDLNLNPHSENISLSLVNHTSLESNHRARSPDSNIYELSHSGL